MTWEYVDEKRIMKIIKHITGKMGEDDGELLPTVRVKGKGTMWCYSPTKKSLVRIERGTDAYVVDYTQDDRGRILIYMKSSQIIAIETEEIEEIGFN